MAIVLIEGVEFELDDAHVFAERALAYAEANPEAMPRPGLTLAVQLGLCVRAEGAFDVTLSEGEKVAASAILDEWLQSHDAPEAARTLYRVLAC